MEKVTSSAKSYQKDAGRVVNIIIVADGQFVLPAKIELAWPPALPLTGAALVMVGLFNRPRNF